MFSDAILTDAGSIAMSFDIVKFDEIYADDIEKIVDPDYAAWVIKNNKHLASLERFGLANGRKNTDRSHIINQIKDGSLVMLDAFEAKYHSIFSVGGQLKMGLPTSLKSKIFSLYASGKKRRYVKAYYAPFDPLTNMFDSSQEPLPVERVVTPKPPLKISVDNSPPIINMSKDRQKSIIENTPAIFEIKSNPNADGSKPLTEISILNPIDTGEVYNKIGNKYGVDPDWLKAIAYLENTHGPYDAIPFAQLANEVLRGQPPSYRPMNVQYDTWKPIADELGFSEWQVQYRVECNVEIAALIIKRISDRIIDPTLEKVATIYNFAGAENVRDYGARVQKIYEERLWEK
ncbi:hypothetical protein PSSHI_06610 [Photobacterium sp. R1]